MDLAAAQSLALQLMAQHGLRNDINFGTPKYWAFAWNHRKRNYGICSYRQRTIFLSKPLTRVNDEKDVRDTILHEIAHALTPTAGHGRIWKLQAMAIGAKPQACSAAKAVVEGRWQAVCPGCGTVHHKYRRPRASRNVACSHCCRRHNGGYYDTRYQLTFQEVRP